MVEQKISSDITLLFKTVIPGLMLAALVVWTVFHVGENGMSWKLIGLVPGYLFLAPSGIYLLRLKQIILTDNGIKIGNYFRTILVPYVEIAEAHLIQTARGSAFVTLRLRYPSCFGNRIRFMPSMSYLPIGKHPDIIRLKGRCPSLVCHKSWSWRRPRDRRRCAGRRTPTI
jgi:hypothetical protein